MKEKRFVCHCKHCGKEFVDEDNCAVHEESECLLNPQLMKKDENPFQFLKFVIRATLSVAAIGLIVLSPVILYPLLLGHREPYSYIALGLFWFLIIGAGLFPALIDYIRKRRWK